MARSPLSIPNISTRIKLNKAIAAKTIISNAILVVKCERYIAKGIERIVIKPIGIVTCFKYLIPGNDILFVR